MGQLRPESRAKLTTRQRRFVDEYAIDGNATQAAIRAGYTKNAASEAGHWLLSNAQVKAAVDANEAKRSAKALYTAEQVIRDLLPLTNVDIANFLVDNGDGTHSMAGINDIAKLPREITAQIMSIDQYEKYDQFGNPERVIKFKLHDRTKAVGLLGKHKTVQAFVEKVEVSNSLAATIDELKRRRSG